MSNGNAQNRVALVSLLVTSSIERNLSAMADAVERAHAETCGFVCFPECALTGLVNTEDYESDLKLAVEIPGSTTHNIGSLARDYSLYIATGILERERERIYDTAVLFNDEGKIILKYRRINPKWHSPNAQANLYTQGTDLTAVPTPFGRIAFAICGDMFDDTVVPMIHRAKPDYLIVPLARSFANYSQDWWDKEEKWAYARQIARIGVTSLLVNSFESEAQWPSFGGSLVVSSDGQIIAETGTGKPSFLVHEFSGPV